MASVRQALIFVSLLSSLPIVSVSASGATKKAVSSNNKASSWTLPLTFEENAGQMPAEVGFLGRAQLYTVAIGQKELRFSLPGGQAGAPVVLSFDGGHAAAPAGVTQAPLLTNYYVGSDPSRYRKGIRNYSRVGLSHVYPGVDAEFYASGDRIEHDFIVAQGADASLIAMKISASRKAILTNQGEVLIPSEQGELRLKKPVAYQTDSAGRQIEVAASFLLDGQNEGSQEIRFKLGRYDHSRRLVIDPVIVYATFAGGSAGSTATAIATDATGDVYLTGYTTSTAASFAGTGTTPNIYEPSPATTAVFVAQFPNAQNGSQIGWLTYLGSSTGVSQSKAIALKAGGTKLYLGGSTNASDFPGTVGGFQSTVTGSGGNWSFISSLNIADGTIGKSTYVDSAPGVAGATTVVNALAVDGSGNVLAAGSATGSTLPLSADAVPVNAAVLASTVQKGFILKLNPALSTESFGTYLMGDDIKATSISSVAVDPTEHIYVAGYTAGDFPQAGSYSSTTMNAHNASDTTGNDSFVAKVMPTGTSTAATLGYSVWLSGKSTDQINAIALDSSQNLFLFGQTSSTDLLSNTKYTSAGATPVTTPSPGQLGSAAPVTATFPTKSGGATKSGFIGRLDATGQPIVVTYLGGNGNDTVTGGAVDSTGKIYATGTTSSTAPSFYATASILPTGQDNTSSSVQRAFVLQLPSHLTAVDYVANVGGSGGSDTGVAVALDSSQNAYIAGNIGTSSTPYTSYTAFQDKGPSTTASSAYVAEIADSTVSAGLVLTVASGSPDIDPIGYSASSASKVKYTWVLTSSAAAAPANLVVQIPALTALSYDSIAIVDRTTSSTSIPCTISPAGASCLIASFPKTSGTNDTLNIVLKATVLVAAPTSGSVSIKASVFGPAPDLVSSSQTSHFSLPSHLTITPSSTFGATTVFAATNGTASPNTQATYAFVVSNAAGAGESKDASFSLSTLPANFKVATVTAAVLGGGIATTCDTSIAASGCAALDLPAGASLTYTLVGTYPNSALNSSGVYTAAPSFTASASGFLSTVTSQTINPNTTVQRGVHLKVTGSLSAPPNSQTAFNLGDSLTYSINIVNSGPSASSGSDPLTVTLPSGFVATGASGITCSAPYTSCTIPVIATGLNITYVITGSFPDTGVNASVKAATQSKTFTAVATLNSSSESGAAGTDYSTTSSTAVQRTAVLTVSASSLTPPASVCGGSSSCVYMQNTSDTKDRVPYNFVIQNAGPNVALNANITITLPSAPANPVGTAHPLNPGTPVSVIVPPGFGAALTCTYASGTNQINCTGGNLPVGTTPLKISGNATIDSGALPATTEHVTTSSGSVAVTEDANGAPGATTLPAIEVDRAAHLVTTKTFAASGTSPVLPINLDENAPSTTAGVNDTLKVTVQVGNTPLNDAPGVTLTETLPPYFRLIQIPAASVNCTVGGVALTVNYQTQATPMVMTCALGTVAAGSWTPAVGSTPASFGAGSQSFTYAGKFVDNGINPDITGTLPAKQPQVSPALGSAQSLTTLAVDPISPSNATSTSPTVTVDRVAHLILRKTRNTSVAIAPSTFTDLTDPNLDEKKTATTFGVNDEVEYDIAVGNAGVNKALGVQFTETLPPYFTLLKAYLISGASTLPDSGANAAPGGQLPANDIACYLGSAASGTPLALPYATGGASVVISCSYGTAANPLSLPVGPSHTGSPDNGTAIEFVYQGKYQDNAPAADNIGAGVSTYAVASNVGDASAAATLAVDNGPASDSKSLAVPTYSIQRAAHLAIIGTPLQLKPDETALTAGGPGNTSIIAEAEPSSTGSSTPVYNCLRYKVQIQNSGPNIARQPQLTVTPPSGLVLTESPNAYTTTPGSDAPLPSTCAYGATTSPTISETAMVPVSEKSGNTLVVDLDAYFGLNTLPAVNAQTGFALTYASLADKGVMDSVKASAFTPVTGSNVTVVNTPVGSNFIVSPFSASGTRPAILTFGTTTAPGATVLSVGGTGPALPSGISPDPRDSKTTAKALYKTGTAAPSFYTLATSAVPVPGTNPTGICLTSGSASTPLADGFAKPERVLLWALAGLPTGTTLNSVPNITSPYTGDITSSVTPSGAANYLAPGGPALPYTTFANLPAPQSQPAQVCGSVNGFAPAAAPVTLAVLEPVNFAPYISGTIQGSPTTTGKGLTEVSITFPQIHDYNDNDPCYVIGTNGRSTCDDNLLLTTWMFGGGNLLATSISQTGGGSQIIGPLSPAVLASIDAANSPIEVQASGNIYIVAADQLAAPLYNAHSDCDPGVNASGSYTATLPNCPISTSLLTGTPPQTTVFGSTDVAEFTVSGGGGLGLIILPPAVDATSPTTVVNPAYPTATATVTAGQTVGFQWKLSDIIPSTGGTYNLTCYMVDTATKDTVVAFPTGLSCQIPATVTYPGGSTTAATLAALDPAIYVVTTGSLTAEGKAPKWRTVAGGIAVALLLPMLLLRRRSAYAKRFGLLIVLMLLGGALGLSGCGSGVGTGTTTTPVTANTYYFRATATPIKGSGTLTTAPFQVNVVAQK